MWQFFEEMAFSCKFYRRVEMAESFEALVDTVPDIVTLVELNNVVTETWDFILALRFAIHVPSMLNYLFTLFKNKYFY